MIIMNVSGMVTCVMTVFELMKERRFGKIVRRSFDLDTRIMPHMFSFSASLAQQQDSTDPPT
jgi:hypothetical protein